jgi:hypothetical protein
MPTTRTANRTTKNSHAATLTRQGLKSTYDCDCGQTFTGTEGSAKDRWEKHALSAQQR